MNNIKLTWILLLFTTGFTYSQDLSLSFITSIDYSYRILENQALRDDYEEGLTNYRVGVDIDKELNAKIAIKTGIRYVKIGYKTNDEDLSWGSEHDGMGGYEPDPILPFSGTKQHIYHFLEFPVNVRYDFINKKWELYIEGGGSINYSLAKKWKEKYEFNRLNFSTNIGLGIKSMINDKIAIFGMPIFRYHLTETLKDTVVENLYSLGLEVGLKMKI